MTTPEEADAHSQQPATDLDQASQELDKMIEAAANAAKALRAMMVSAKKVGVSANEIARRVHAAGIQSRPTTLAQLSQGRDLRPRGSST